MDAAEEQPQGYDVPAVEAWIADHTDQLTPPLTWSRAQGGHSNLTYRIEDNNSQAAIIRRPPLGQLLPKAHDMSREWALISALAPTEVPVASPIAFCEDPGVTGAWFYLMGLVDGRALYSAADTEAWVPEPERTGLAHSFIDVLAALHALDPDAIGLEELGRKEDYIARQVRTWYGSWTSSMADANYDEPAVHDLKTLILETIPEQGRARVVHGDYGLHNCLTGPDARIAAVVDWEISTLGDPLADLAYALNQWAEPSEAGREEAATALSGFPTRQDLADRYARKTGRDLAQLDFYTGFNWWKSACIIHGVYARYQAGKKSSEGVDVERLRDRVGECLNSAAEALGRFRAK